MIAAARKILDAEDSAKDLDDLNFAGRQDFPTCTLSPPTKLYADLERA